MTQEKKDCQLAIFLPAKLYQQVLEDAAKLGISASAVGRQLIMQAYEQRKSA